ncbi:hypothetical protein LCGC14_2661960, partial [marine sediment metagenome]
MEIDIGVEKFVAGREFANRTEQL